MACGRDLQTSEPRDLIYAMLEISSDCQNGGIMPNYDQPLVGVYIETITFCHLKTDRQFQRTLAEKLRLSYDEHLQRRIKNAPPYYPKPQPALNSETIEAPLN
jgi:hypothetical protein